MVAWCCGFTDRHKRHPLGGGNGAGCVWKPVPSSPFVVNLKLLKQIKSVLKKIR